MGASLKQIPGKQKSLQLVGLLLWRAGLLLAAATALYRTARFLLRFIELPLQLEIGVALIAVGAAFVMISLLMERWNDYRAEGDLSQ